MVRLTDHKAAEAAYLAYNQAMGLDLESAQASWQQLLDYRPDIVNMWDLAAEAAVNAE
jgi:hypothetical protein